MAKNLALMGKRGRQKPTPSIEYVYLTRNRQVDVIVNIMFDEMTCITPVAAPNNCLVLLSIDASFLVVDQRVNVARPSGH